LNEAPLGVGELLDIATSALPAAERRPGQREMADAVDRAISDGRHLVVQAGTGTGKTLAYLVPAMRAGRTVVVATATKALQDQLATKDLPFLAEHLREPLGRDLEWAVLKGRSNYLCRQRLAEVSSGDDQLALEGLGDGRRDEITALAGWAESSDTGDQAELDRLPDPAVWRAVSVTSDECPGANRCPLGATCFAEVARDRAATADVVVVNTHLYGLNVGADDAILPEHDIVVFDEAHVLEDVMSDTVGVDLSPGRFTTVASTVRRIIDDPALIASIADAGVAFGEVIDGRRGERLEIPLPSDVTSALVTARGALERASAVVNAIETDVEDARQRRLRAQVILTRSTEMIDRTLSPSADTVAFVSGAPGSPSLEIAPLDVGPTMAAGVWSRRTAILTSATVPRSLPERIGLPDPEVIDVGSPFDYGENSLLYCAMHLPAPNDPAFRAATHEELAALITAAGGRTLALFTSWAAMDEAAAALTGQIPHTILTQRDLPKPALVAAFAEDESTCLFATAGLFQGVDVPGRTLSLVVIDRIPFPRPDDPLLSARRDRLGRAAFGQIDLPRAATMLAQASGRLIRNDADRGVVAVLDRRLGTAGYRWDLIGALPPMRRTRDRAEAERFLRAITD
jgi:ATP-dependent DNA helicase DinG